MLMPGMTNTIRAGQFPAARFESDSPRRALVARKTSNPGGNAMPEAKIFPLERRALALRD